MNFGCIPFTFDNYGAASEIIDDNINGCLIPPFKLQIYAERLADLMQDKLRRVSMSQAAIEKVQTFSIERVADLWENLFETVKTNKGNSF
jgi:glycosyltransferase involved in cell wall biosynthesis